MTHAMRTPELLPLPASLLQYFPWRPRVEPYEGALS